MGKMPGQKGTKEDGFLMMLHVLYKRMPEHLEKEQYFILPTTRKQDLKALSEVIQIRDERCLMIKRLYKKKDFNGLARIMVPDFLYLVMDGEEEEVWGKDVSTPVRMTTIGIYNEIYLAPDIKDPVSKKRALHGSLERKPWIVRDFRLVSDPQNPLALELWLLDENLKLHTFRGDPSLFTRLDKEPFSCGLDPLLLGAYNVTRECFITRTGVKEIPVFSSVEEKRSYASEGVAPEPLELPGIPRIATAKSDRITILPPPEDWPIKTINPGQLSWLSPTGTDGSK